MKPAVLAPTFIGAWAGADDRLPTWQHAFADPRPREATDLMVRLLREKAAFEANPFDENNGLLVAASVFPFFYALAGERNPKQAPKAGPRSPYSQLACDAFEVIREDGPISRQKLGEKLGGGLSNAALDRGLGRTLGEVANHACGLQGFRRCVVGCAVPLGAGGGERRIGLSVPAALSALVSKYLDCVVAAEPQEVEVFLG